MKEDSMKCMECGKDCEILLTATKNRDRNGNDFWVCDECFIKIEGLEFDDYGAKQ